MNKLDQPSKGQVREWLMQRRAKHDPPPDGEQIRRELGWRLVRHLRNS